MTGTRGGYIVFIMKVLIILFLSTFVSLLYARPISYEGGWTVMTRNDWFQSVLHVHYSPNVNNSIGMVYIDLREDQVELAGLQWNHLLYRKNTKNSQGNLYLMSQFGGTIQRNTQLWGHLTLAGDWETRRYFTSYRGGLFYGDDLSDGEFAHYARVGIAPYLGDYGDFHTWLMLQIEHRPERDDQMIVTSLVRFFKGVYLVEFGVNDRGDFLFNGIIRL